MNNEMQIMTEQNLDIDRKIMNEMFAFSQSFS